MSRSQHGQRRRTTAQPEKCLFCVATSSRHGVVCQRRTPVVLRRVSYGCRPGIQTDWRRRQAERRPPPPHRRREYTGDVQLRGMTYMAVLRSPHAHAPIRRIDAASARQQPGVLAVLTGQEVDQQCQRQFPLAGVREGMNTKSSWPMATAVAKYAGEPVAVVVATSSGRAQDALAMIEVAYEPLPAVLDLEQAVEGGPPGRRGSGHQSLRRSLGGGGRSRPSLP